MTANQLASFPNSRIKPRPARTSTVGGNPLIITVPTGVAYKIADANPNRTDAVVRNLDSTVDIYYGYTNAVDGSSDGMILKALDSVTIEDPGEIWIFQSSGGDINISIDQGQG